MADAIALGGVTKTFGDTVAVRDLDLTIPEGALCGFIGPNGAGKTTTIRMILSILFPDRGDLLVLGHRSALEAKDRIGYLPEERGLYRRMRVGSFLAYIARLKNAGGPDLPRRVTGWLEKVGLAEVERKRCEELSKGMQQKLQFVAAVIHKPDLLVLDEPFSGLDPINQRLLRNLVLEEHKRGATILLSTHVMVQAEQLCHNVVMIHRGAKVLDEPIAAIRANYDPRSVLFESLTPGADVTPLGSVPGVQSVRRDRTGWEVDLADGADPAAVLRGLAAAVPASRIELRRPTLEDVFVKIVGGGAEAVENGVKLRALLREEGAVPEARA